LLLKAKTDSISLSLLKRDVLVLLYLWPQIHAELFTVANDCDFIHFWPWKIYSFIHGQRQITRPKRWQQNV